MSNLSEKMGIYSIQESPNEKNDSFYDIRASQEPQRNKKIFSSFAEKTNQIETEAGMPLAENVF